MCSLTVTEVPGSMHEFCYHWQICFIDTCRQPSCQRLNQSPDCFNENIGVKKHLFPWAFVNPAYFVGTGHCFHRGFNTWTCFPPTIFQGDTSLRTDTQLRFSFHFTPLVIRFPRCVTQPFVFLVLETIIHGRFRNDHSRTFQKRSFTNVLETIILGHYSTLC